MVPRRDGDDLRGRFAEYDEVPGAVLEFLETMGRR